MSGESEPSLRQKGFFGKDWEDTVILTVWGIRCNKKTYGE